MTWKRISLWGEPPVITDLWCLSFVLVVEETVDTPVFWRAMGVRWYHCNKGKALQWRHNEHDGGSNHRRLDGLLNRLLRRSSKKTSKFRVTGPLWGEFTRLFSFDDVIMGWYFMHLAWSMAIYQMRYWHFILAHIAIYQWYTVIKFRLCTGYVPNM